ncbi:hypothetical protein PseudUWO311_00625 [Pseudanabaena sp. UWO311]|uniref:hypothetical protein n=1 Tax=Pseudanabaena sp. UWO311 TaxID=2487337 RepID=UPI00115AC824|nr:hypothetical protein [Pseudanabaena sp. UWO311]TYQ29435.1 hypothetical protein PseudUWO311_00625 [Pseudanabaena sp. UWO311]
MSLFLGLVCFAIAAGTIFWAFQGSYQLEKLIQYLVWAAIILLLGWIAFLFANFLVFFGLTIPQGLFVVVSSSIFLILLVLGIKYELDKVKPSRNKVSRRENKREKEQYLLSLIRDQATCDRILEGLRRNYPNRSRLWLIEKAIEDVLRDRQ